MRRFLPTGFVLFVVGGLVSGLLALSNLATVIDRGTRPEPANSVNTTMPVVLTAPQPGPTPLPTPPAVLRSSGSSAVAQAAPGNGLAYLYVIGGDLWVSGGGAQFQLTQGAQISQPVLSDDAVAFVERQRNASDVWLASSDTPLRPVTHNASSIVSQNHWASQPVFMPGRSDLFVVGDFNKGSTGPGSLAIWELNLQQQSVTQITRPPEYAGGDQDVTLNPTDPRQMIFTRYSYTSTRLAEQLEWMDVTTRTPVALTQPDRPARQASYSPDGTSIAFIQAGRGSNQDLWIARVEMSSTGVLLQEVRQVATGVMANPVWSPDGSELAYDALTKDQFQLWSLDLMPDTTGALQTVGHPRQITNGPGVDATSRPVFMTRDQTARIRDWLTLPSAHS